MAKVAGAVKQRLPGQDPVGIQQAGMMNPDTHRHSRPRGKIVRCVDQQAHRITVGIRVRLHALLLVPGFEVIARHQLKHDGKHGPIAALQQRLVARWEIEVDFECRCVLQVNDRLLGAHYL